jgi:hypothetical protein
LKQIKDYFQSIINLETENVTKIDIESLEKLIEEGLIKSDKDRKKSTQNKKDDLPTDSTFFSESESLSFDVSELKAEVKQNQNYTSSAANKETSYLTKSYFDTWQVHFNIKLNYEDTELATWVYALKTKGTTPEYTKKLDDIEFNWDEWHYEKTSTSKSSHITEEWRTKVNDVKKLSLEGIDVNNITSDLSHLEKTKAWLVSQQQRYRGGELKKEQIHLLTEAGVKLEKVSKQEQRWEALYELLTLYKEENGDCRVTNLYDEELRGWVATQKISFKEKTLDQKKIDRLNELDFEWSGSKSRKKVKLSPNI